MKEIKTIADVINALNKIVQECAQQPSSTHKNMDAMMRKTEDRIMHPVFGLNSYYALSKCRNMKKYHEQYG